MKIRCRQLYVDHERGVLIPPFSVLDGLGERRPSRLSKPARMVSLSPKKIYWRGQKLNNTNLEHLNKLGVLNDLGDPTKFRFLNLIVD
jgi:DNA polymerase III alpha subunit (gram-positive type)